MARRGAGHAKGGVSASAARRWTERLAILGLASPVVPIPFYAFDGGPTWLQSAILLGTPTIWLAMATLHVRRSGGRAAYLLLVVPVAYAWVVAAAYVIVVLTIACAYGQCI